MLQVYADPLLSPDTTDVFQILKCKKDVYLRGVRARLVVYNDPDFSGLKCSLRTVKNGMPASVRAISSNTLSKAEITTTGNGLREVYFEFELPYGFRILENEEIAICIEVQDYIPAADSYLAFVRAWPRPVYIPSFDPTPFNQNQAPFYLGVIGGHDEL
ncbi:hypothetical protein [Bdellovibrio bacteriovorus]|uniref:hypothetical protein n=1 Tax=Bdellovibrio bacteriovorus TaxID=959 RepID=UPI0035A65DE0